MRNYGEKKYWEKHYKNIESNNTFDWILDYSDVKGIISSLNIPKESAKILNVGCGNSEFSENMYDDGYHDIQNIDISKELINSMKERNKNRPGLKYELMDVFNMKFKNNFFDLIIDKGTLDAISCSYDYNINIAKMLKEIQRVLKISGYYMIISYESPENRIIHLKRKFLNFKVDSIKIKQSNNKGIKDDFNYIYLCQKLECDDEYIEKCYNKTIKELIEQEEIEDELDEIYEENKYKSNNISNINIYNNEIN